MKKENSEETIKLIGHLRNTDKVRAQMFIPVGLWNVYKMICYKEYYKEMMNSVNYSKGPVGRPPAPDTEDFTRYLVRKIIKFLEQDKELFEQVKKTYGKKSNNSDGGGEKQC